MSFVSLVLVRERKIMFVQEHYRRVMQILESEALPEQLMEIDGGYIVFDFDSKIILDRQSCFSVSDLREKGLAGFIKEMKLMQ